MSITLYHSIPLPSTRNIPSATKGSMPLTCIGETCFGWQPKPCSGNLHLLYSDWEALEQQTHSPGKQIRPQWLNDTNLISYVTRTDAPLWPNSESCHAKTKTHNTLTTGWRWRNLFTVDIEAPGDPWRLRWLYKGAVRCLSQSRDQNNSDYNTTCKQILKCSGLLTNVMQKKTILYAYTTNYCLQ